MRQVLGTQGQYPLILRGSQAQGRVRAWPDSPTIAQLVLYTQSTPPSSDDLRQWCDQLRSRGYVAIRTGALPRHLHSLVTANGFVPLQHLVLLECPTLHRRPFQGLHGLALRPQTQRLHRRHLEQVAGVDLAAFGAPWHLDESTIDDIRTATPYNRARIVRRGGAIVGYAVSGRDTRTGYLQRLAVHPDAQRTGIGAALVADSLAWIRRHDASRTLVNTHVGNEAALDLYRRARFVEMDEDLCVFERSLQ